jgi:putative colanic acid biosynthesis glycosyltransferase
MSKVLIEINSVDFGSTGKVASSIKETAIKEGLKAFLVVGQHKRNPSTDYSVADHESHLYLACCSRIEKPHKGYGFTDVSATKRMLRFCEKHFINQKDEVIFHLHNIHGAFLDLKTITDFTHKNGYKLVLTLHDCWYFTGGCAYFDFIDCQKWKNGDECEQCQNVEGYPLIKTLSKKTFEKKKAIFSNLKADEVSVVTPSLWLSNLASQSFLGKFQITTVHHGIDTSHWEPKARQRDGFIRIVALASPWTKRKGLEDINFVAEHLPSRYKITVIGLTDTDKTAPSIERKGHVTDQEVRQILENSDILLNPTNEDNFPAVNIEGLASGNFVITYQTGGSPEALDEQTGLAVIKGDKEALLTAIKSFIPSDKIREKAAARADLFSFEKQNKGYLDFILQQFAK